MIRRFEHGVYGRHESVKQIRSQRDRHRIDGSIKQALAVAIPCFKVHWEEDQIESREDEEDDSEERGIDVHREVEGSIDNIVQDPKHDSQGQMKQLQKQAHADAGGNDVASSHRKHLREDEVALLVVTAEEIGHANPEVIQKSDGIDPLRNEHEQSCQEGNEQVNGMQIDEEFLFYQVTHDGHLGTSNDR
jgi:hypothetical protein